MHKKELRDLKNRALAGIVMEAAAERRLVTYREVNLALQDRLGIEPLGSFDLWHRLGALSAHMLELDLPMASSIVVNEDNDLQPGKAFVRWLVGERTGRDFDEVSEDVKRHLVADEQSETFQRSDEVKTAVRAWKIDIHADS